MSDATVPVVQAQEPGETPPSRLATTGLSTRTQIACAWSGSA